MNKNIISIVTIIIFAVLSVGCVKQHPQTAEEFREAADKAFTGKVETFEVNRPFHSVARTFKSKAYKCLQKTIKTTTSQVGVSYHVVITEYNPTVLVRNNKAELHLQQHHKTGVMNVTKEPKGGYYLLVADAAPLDKRKTRIDLYRPAFGHKNIVKAVRGWATGEDMSCPDLTK